jgi:hypothetical protein
MISAVVGFSFTYGQTDCHDKGNALFMLYRCIKKVNKE